MKLQSLLPQAADLSVLHPVTKEPTGIVLKVVGRDSSQFKQKARELLRASLAKKKEETILDRENENQELVASAIVGWNDEADEAFGSYTPARALEIVKMDELAFMLEQVEEFIAERSNFFRPAA